MPVQATEYTTVAVVRQDGIGTIYLNRPDKRNALNSAMCAELREAIRELDDDAAVSAMLIRARGAVFCAGADLAERKTMNEDQVRVRRMLAFSAYDTIESARKPCVAVVEGPAIGSGAEIVSACDFAIATPSAAFRYPEVGWGTIGATQRLPEIVGRRIAKDLLFTGREVGADEALAIGLISRLIEVDALDIHLRELAAVLGRAPAGALAAAKQCVDERALPARRAALSTELLAIETLLAGGNWRERLAGFRRET